MFGASLSRDHGENQTRDRSGHSDNFLFARAYDNRIPDLLAHHGLRKGRGVRQGPPSGITLVAANDAIPSRTLVADSS